MIILTKRLGIGEINWRGIVIPRDKKDLFPPPGALFDLSDERTTYKVKVDKQYRIRLTEWFGNHSRLKKGDEVIFSKDNGTIHIQLTDKGTSKAVSLKDLLGKETKEGKIIDVQFTPDGPIVVLQGTKEIPLDKLSTQI